MLTVSLARGSCLRVVREEAAIITRQHAKQYRQAKQRNRTRPSQAASRLSWKLSRAGITCLSPDKDIIKQELDKALNIDLNLTVYPSADDYSNQLNVRMSSGNFPDLFMVDRQQLIQFSKQGLLLDLTPYMDKLEQTVYFIGEDSVKKGHGGRKSIRHFQISANSL